MTRIKGQLTTSEHLSFDELMRLFSELHKRGLYKWELYCLVSFYSACRVSDVKTIVFEDILNKPELVVKEKKTGKTRKIPLSKEVSIRAETLYNLMGKPDKTLSVIYNPRTKEPYTTEYINRVLKTFKYKYRLSITMFSTHSFRKSFGRFVWEKKEKTWEAITLLCTILNHKSPQTTMVYLGIREDEKNEVYNLIEFDYK